MRSSAMRAPLAFLTVLALGPAARADDHAVPCGCPIHRHHQVETSPPGKPRDIPHTDARAGGPRTLAAHVQPSTTPGGIGYTVGGGVPFGHGEPANWDHGTWGWDETGWHRFRTRVRLGFSHGRRYQGGTGAYKTDGHPLPDPIAAFHRQRSNPRGNEH